MSKTNDPAPAQLGALEDAYGKVSDRIATAYTSARDKAADAAETTSTGIEANPFAALLGGMVIGAVAGVVIPRLAKEKELLAPVGDRIGGSARAAFDAAKSAGSAALGDAGLDSEGLRAQVSALFEQLVKVAGAAGTAAVGAARGEATDVQAPE